MSLSRRLFDPAAIPAFLISSFILIPSASASPAPSYFTDWIISTVLPQKGLTISDEIKCYGLPYGAIGNASHVLTYWTIGCIFFYRAPWWPWRVLRAGRLDCALGVLQLLVSVGVASLTISRCRNRWQFIVLAAGRLQFSLTLGYCAIHTSIRIMRFPRKQGYNPIDVTTIASHYQRPDSRNYRILSLLPWLVHLSALPSLAAMGSILKQLWSACKCETEDACQVCQNWKHGHSLPIVTISVAFLASIAALLVIFVFLVGRKKSYIRLGEQPQQKEQRQHLQQQPGSHRRFQLHIVIGVVGALVALWCDWVLAVIADNITGAPSGDLAILYWAYFAAKRLPMLFS